MAEPDKPELYRMRVGLRPAEGCELPGSGRLKRRNCWPDETDAFGGYRVLVHNLNQSGDWYCKHRYINAPDQNSYHYINRQGWFYSNNPDGSEEKIHMGLQSFFYGPPGTDIWYDHSALIDWDSSGNIPDPCIGGWSNPGTRFWEDMEAESQRYVENHKRKVSREEEFAEAQQAEVDDYNLSFQELNAQHRQEQIEMHEMLDDQRNERQMRKEQYQEEQIKRLQMSLDQLKDSPMFDEQKIEEQIKKRQMKLKHLREKRIWEEEDAGERARISGKIYNKVIRMQKRDYNQRITEQEQREAAFEETDNRDTQSARSDPVIKEKVETEETPVERHQRERKERRAARRARKEEVRRLREQTEN